MTKKNKSHSKPEKSGGSKIRQKNKIFIKPNGKTAVQVKRKKFPILHSIIKENWNQYCKDYNKATKKIPNGKVTIDDLPTYMIPEEQFKVLQKEVKTDNFQIVLHMNDSIKTWVVLRVKRKRSFGLRILMFFRNLGAKFFGAKAGNVYLGDETK